MASQREGKGAHHSSQRNVYPSMQKSKSGGKGAEDGCETKRLLEKTKEQVNESCFNSFSEPVLGTRERMDRPIALEQAYLRTMPKTGYCIAFFYNKCTKGDDCNFPHWFDEQTADEMSDNSEEEATTMMAAPCIMMEDEPEMMALAGIAVESHEYDQELTRGGHNGNMPAMVNNNNVESYEYDWELIKGGRNGDIMFVIDNDGLQRCEKGMNDPEKENTQVLKYAQKWENQIEREIESICARHRAEFMHLALNNTVFDKCKCFEWHEYAVQTTIWDLDTLDMDSQWAGPECKSQTKPIVSKATEIANPDLVKGLWMMDTGCGQYLINETMAEGYKTKSLDRPITFSTPNGRVLAHKTVPMYSKAMGGHMEPLLLSDTPPVLSVGRRCMEQGYSFHWEAYEAPYLVNPQGACIALSVEKNIPFFDAQDEGTTSPLRTYNDNVLAAAACQEAKKQAAVRDECDQDNKSK